MKYSKKAIIFSDCDSTLLNDDCFFSKKTKETVKKLYKKGMFLIPVTARSTQDVFNQAKRLQIDKFGGIMVANNGSQIYDFNNDFWIANEYLPTKIVKELFKAFFQPNETERVAKVHFFSDDSTYVFNEGISSTKWAQLMGSDYIVTHDFSDINQKINHLTIVIRKGISQEESKKIMDEIIAKYSPLVDCHIYTNRVMEISPKNINKGSAVKKIVEYLNIDTKKTKTYAFGDSYNDFSMFEEVEFGIAMKNAVPQLKEIADGITEETNHDDGVANYIIKNII